LQHIGENEYSNSWKEKPFAGGRRSAWVFEGRSRGIPIFCGDPARREGKNEKTSSFKENRKISCSYAG